MGLDGAGLEKGGKTDGQVGGRGAGAIMSWATREGGGVNG
jgi:hypothetical protein